MNIFFSGIGGVGLGPLAEIALGAGHRVFGTDPSDSLMSRELTAAGVQINRSQDGEFLRLIHSEHPIDWLVHTAAMPTNHPELIVARELGIRVSKRDELLAEIIQSKGMKLIAVSGTHGKTTTTGMLVWTLMQLGVPVSYSVGTTLSYGPSGMFDPKSEYFVYECDEFDRNFLHFSPYVSLVTSLGYDHSDTYATAADYKAAFRQFLDQSNMSILWQRDSDYAESTNASSWCMQEDEVMEIALTGIHNRRNATLVLKTLERLGIGSKEANEHAVQSFPGTNRRFEKLAENLYTDYGHHPTEIAATLQLARELSDHVVLVYQPHQNVRQHEIKNLYRNCFKQAETVYWLPTYLSREDPDLPILTPEELTQDISNKSDIHIVSVEDNLKKAIDEHLAAGHLVLCMGAGSIDSWVRTKVV